MAGIAQEESRKISERVKWGQRRQMEKGIVFGRRLLGYEVKNGKIEIKEEERKIVYDIFRRFDSGESVRKIWEREFKNIITEGGIRKILRNEKYVGDLCQGKSYTIDFLSHRKKYNKGEKDFIYIKNHHEGIIDRELWERVQKKLGKRERKTTVYDESGKIYCGLCGSLYIMKKRGEYRQWRCSKNCRYGRQGCSNGGINDIAVREIINAAEKKTGQKFEMLSVNKGFGEVCFDKGKKKIKVYFDVRGKGEGYRVEIEKIE